MPIPTPNDGLCVPLLTRPTGPFPAGALQIGYPGRAGAERPAILGKVSYA